MKRSGPPTRLVRYGAMGWVGEYTHKSSLDLPTGGRVVIQSDRGIELGELLGPGQPFCGTQAFADQVRAYIDTSGPDFCRTRAGRIMRVAGQDDLNEHWHLNLHVSEDIRRCAELAHQLELDIRIVTAEHLLGGERIVFYFRSPSRVDFRQLVKELAHHYRTRIEMRQVGARDEARLVADYEICGQECCCRTFLKRLRPVNMKMAKLQKSTLDPSKVSGRCGRLRCCLRYEHPGYEELVKKMPRVGSRVESSQGTGKVVDRHLLTQLIAIRTDDDRMVTVPLEEITAFNVPPAPPREEAPPRRSEPRGRTRDRKQSPDCKEKPAREDRKPPEAAPKEEEEKSASRSRRRRRSRRKKAGAAEETLPEARKPDPPAESRFKPETDVVTGDDAKPTDNVADSKPPRPEQSASGETASEEAPRKRRRRRRRRSRKSDDSPPKENSESGD